MACDTPIQVFNKRGEPCYVPCGRCLLCKDRLVRQWIYRLEVEDRHSTSAFFVTLTYNSNSLVRTPTMMPTITKKEAQDFINRLRKNEKKLRYYIVGEYGSQNYRPHYHALLFNCEEVNIRKAWIVNGSPKGSIDVGTVTGESIAYTVKYMNKPSKVPRFKSDDRHPEFSLKSKGLGKQFLTDSMKRYLKADYSRNYVVNSFGYKVALPKYYVDNTFTDTERVERRNFILKELALAEQERMQRFFDLYNMHGDIGAYEKYEIDNRKSRFGKLYKIDLSRNNIK